ncbi:SCO3242 family prenyltransferase [Amycolatopsis anabasis]|uniref:SCO3242 family prenyltransferase n=1 Tax=Amycolatopsis anabasis TaxID=1840409 RepID=UPI00131CAE97|nr:UbiA family prenyltransferase [Amycolatopsis anabasis]
MKALAELVRAPAALTVFGDTAAGAAAAGRPLSGRRLLLPVASVAFYWAGMALNDWADRRLDAVERPERPIPSGRVRPGTALGVASGLTAAGLGLAGFAEGRRALRVAVPLAGAVWAYDTWLKRTPAGPFGMAACRVLDVLLGGAGAPAAAAIGVHTLGVTALSGGEVHGGSPATARAAALGTAIAGGLAVRRGSGLVAAALGAGYAASVGGPQLRAAREPSGGRIRRATAAGIHGMLPLQASIAARHGSVRTAAVLTAVLPCARRLGKRVSPT